MKMACIEHGCDICNKYITKSGMLKIFAKILISH